MQLCKHLSLFIAASVECDGNGIGKGSLSYVPIAEGAHMTGKPIEDMTPTEHLKYCRELALDAARKASLAATAVLQQQYLAMASEWNDLAGEFERLA